MSEELNDIQHGEIRPVDINHEMQRSYLDYAMSVIVSRALPDVRDGLKPVHRRVLYAMYDGGYRPDKAFSKCARVVGDVMGTYHPHGDSAIYDTLVRLAQPWSLRYPLVQGQGNFGSPGNDPAAAMRYTESRMAQLAMEMVRDIDEETVDFTPNYDGRTQEPLVLPSRFPNLLANGSSGIAVGMATNIPPHNLREISDGVIWALENPTASKEELLEALIERIKGPDFPTGALIVGRRGIENAYRTGRGSITMRAVVEVEEEAKGNRKQLVVTELPYQVNPDNLAEKIADLVNSGKITGISELRDESSGRTGMRLCIVLSRNAVPKVVLNNLYKHTQLQDTFGANMLALVDGVPRTLTLDMFVSNWITHQIEVIQRRTRYRLRKAQERAHILLGLLKAIDRIDEVIALIRRSPSAADASIGLMQLLEIDELQARAILDMQLRKLAALERQELQDEFDKLMAMIREFESILASDERQRQIVKDELAEIVAKHGDERRSRFVADEGEMRDEDFIAERDVVITITAGGYVKRTDASNYRAQKRGGRGVKGAALKQDDVVSHFFITTTHHWILFFTNKGRVYRAKAYELPEAGRDAKGSHVANVMEFQEDETVTQVLYLKDYEAAPYLVLATKQGVIKKTSLAAYDSRLTRGLIAINLKEDDELISAQLIGESDDLILVTKDGYSVRFTADNATLRPMGRATAGVIGIRFKRETDSLLSMDVVRENSYLFTATDGGFAKRTPLVDWNSKGRGTQGVRAMRLVEERGSLVGAVVVDENDEVFAIASNGVVIRTRVSDVRSTGRDTMGVRLMNLAENDSLISIARAAESDEDEEVEGSDEAQSNDVTALESAVEIDTAEMAVESESDGE